MSSAALLSVLVIGWLYFFLLPLRWQNRRLAGPDPELKRALAAASCGRWEPAAQLLTTAGDDWERRALYTQRLAELAARKGDSWIQSWRTARPGDPDAALVHARTRFMYAEHNLRPAAQYRAHVGNLGVPRSHTEEVNGEAVRLGAWISQQRVKAGKLSGQQVAELSAVDIRWA